MVTERGKIKTVAHSQIAALPTPAPAPSPLPRHWRRRALVPEPRLLLLRAIPPRPKCTLLHCAASSEPESCGPRCRATHVSVWPRSGSQELYILARLAVGGLVLHLLRTRKKNRAPETATCRGSKSQTGRENTKRNRYNLGVEQGRRLVPLRHLLVRGRPPWISPCFAV